MNPFLKKLGFSSSDRVAIVHADDIGAYQPMVLGGFLTDITLKSLCDQTLWPGHRGCDA